MNHDLIAEHKAEKRESHDFKSRKFPHWNENYALYRDKVSTNRLTQRQAINLPIIRETVQTWISKIDEPPELHFKSRGKTVKHRNGEIIMDEMWKYYYDKLSLDILDNLDKKIVGLQGRSFKIAGMNRGEFFVDIIDPYDIEISPRANILDLNSAQYVIRTHIFKPIQEIMANPKYLAEGKAMLKGYLDTKEGMIKAGSMYDSYVEKNDRLKQLGAMNFDEYNASQTVIELNESYKLVWNAAEKRFVRHLIIIAADCAVLYDKPLKEARGISKMPIVTWADDPDLNDIWCDGKADSTRTINKVLNMYISSDLENRTYQTYGMHFFNTLNGQFKPRAFDPKPFGMYGVPGNPNEIIKSMEIPRLPDTLNQIEFLKNLIQSSVAQTATERGEQTKSRTTLGEIELNLQQSGQRNTVSSKNYRRAWKQIGELFYELVSNNSNGTITLYKEGGDGQLQPKTIYPSDFIFPEGYHCEVVMKSESDARDQFMLQKTQYVISAFQNNPTALNIAKRKQLELMGWTSDEVESAMQMEEQMAGMGQQPQEGGAQPPEGQAGGKPFNNQQVMQQMTA